MKILLINNYQQGNETATFEALRTSLSDHEVRMQRYQPGLIFEDRGIDLVILSGGGGEGSEINDQYNQHKLWYQDQINYVLSAKKPILGICMGFEVIARAYGSKVVEMKNYITGFKKIVPTDAGRLVFGQESLRQYENHKYYVRVIASEQFEVLAESASGVEVIKHKSHPIFATQFHPEKGGTLSLSNLLSSLTT